MQFEILANGNLKIRLEDDDDREVLETIMGRPIHQDHGVLSQILDYTGWQPNGKLFQVPAEAVGGLTDSPILSDDANYRDDGSIEVFGRVWWYPNYQVESFAEQLLQHGEVTFTFAPPVSESATPSC